MLDKTKQAISSYVSVLQDYTNIVDRILIDKQSAIDSSQQRCKVCGRTDKFNYHVSDKLWDLVISEPFKDKVVCLSCFDDFAASKSISYANHIKVLYFVGNKAMFKFGIKKYFDV